MPASTETSIVPVSAPRMVFPDLGLTPPVTKKRKSSSTTSKAAKKKKSSAMPVRLVQYLFVQQSVITPNLHSCILFLLQDLDKAPTSQTLCLCLSWCHQWRLQTRKRIKKQKKRWQDMGRKIRESQKSSDLLQWELEAKPVAVAVLPWELEAKESSMSNWN